MRLLWFGLGFWVLITIILVGYGYIDMQNNPELYVIKSPGTQLSFNISNPLQMDDFDAHNLRAYEYQYGMLSRVVLPYAIFSIILLGTLLGATYVRLRDEQAKKAEIREAEIRLLEI